MVGVFDLSANSDCDADNATKHVNKGPPRIVGKVAVQAADDGRNKGDDPGELVILLAWRLRRASMSRTRTRLMEMVDRAKGSPRMLPKLKRARLP